MSNIYLVCTNRGQFPADEAEAYAIAENAGYSKKDIEEYFETSSSNLTINWKGWHFQLAI